MRWNIEGVRIYSDIPYTSTSKLMNARHIFSVATVTPTINQKNISANSTLFSVVPKNEV